MSYFNLGVKEDIIYFLFKLGSSPWCDAPYSIWQTKNEWRSPPPVIPRESDILLEIILIDSSTGIVRAIRAFSLSESVSHKLTNAIIGQLQLASPISKKEYDRRIDRHHAILMFD